MFNIPREEIDEKLLTKIEIIKRPDDNFKIPPGKQVICAVQAKNSIEYYACDSIDDIRKIFDKNCKVLSWHTTEYDVERIAIEMMDLPGGIIIGVIHGGEYRKTPTALWIIKDPTGAKKLSCDSGNLIISFKSKEAAQQLINDLAKHGAKPCKIDREKLQKQARQAKKKVLQDPPLDYFFTDRPEFY
jgi:hypothetical protein